jgi:UrcA family protein
MNTNIRATVYKTIFCAYWAATVCVLSGPAKADDLPLPTKTVQFGDLDISKSEGAKVLYRRIQAAAHEVCGGSIPYGLSASGVQHTCIDKAIDGAIKNVNSVALTQVRFGSPVRLASK